MIHEEFPRHEPRHDAPEYPGAGGGGESAGERWNPTVGSPGAGAAELTYRQVFEAARDGILIMDAVTGKIRDVNPFLLELLGFEYSEMVGKTLADLGPFRGIGSSQAMIDQLRRQGCVRYDDLPIETRDGRHVDVEFVSNIYDAGGAQVIQCQIRDVTDRKNVELEVLRLNAELERRVAKRTEQLQAANQELEAFSYSVSHDLRAPLRHIVGFVELLQKDAGPTLSEKSVRHLSTISKSAKRMGVLIDDLLAFSSVGRAGLQKVELNLNELVRDAQRDFQVETAERRIEWRIAPLPPVWGDRALLRMVLVNLLGNAVKFTGNRPDPRIEIGAAASSARDTAFYIRDNGAGFDPQYADKLFGVFQRLHSQAEFEGTGIGLANVQRIVRRHGGRVWAEGMVDAGATFYVAIPNRTEVPDES